MDRRGFGIALTAGLAAVVGPRAGTGEPGDGGGGLTDVPGLKLGHFTDTRRPTGCTVVLAEDGATCGVDVRGGAPGTRETDLLAPVNLVEKVHAILLSGGSAFGLDAATGVMRFLEERKVGFPVPPEERRVRVPVVPAAILFDLHLGDWTIRPDAASGYAASRAASAGEVVCGNVGAGAGATVGKLLGMERAMKCGLGTASLRLPGGLMVAALVAVNAFGDIVDTASGKILAGLRTADGRGIEGTMKLLLEGRPRGSAGGGGASSTIGVVATNAALTKTQATKVAQMAHDGLARTINPIHTPWDGDTLFALATGGVETPGPDGLLGVGALGAEAVARAVLRAARAARGVLGIPAAADLASG